MPKSTQFKIRMVAGVSILFADGISFDILDTQNNLLCVYDYRGVSVGKSFPFSATDRGPWNSFKTNIPIEVSRFGGVVRFIAATTGPLTMMHFELTPIGFNMPLPISITGFQTGFTYGGAAGVSGGFITQMFPPVAASKAPWPHNV
jgi:hypothetical protein